MRASTFEFILSRPRRPKRFALVYRSPLFNARKLRLPCGHRLDKWIINKVYQHGVIFECPYCLTTWEYRQ